VFSQSITIIILQPHNLKYCELIDFVVHHYIIIFLKEKNVYPTFTYTIFIFKILKILNDINEEIPKLHTVFWGKYVKKAQTLTQSLCWTELEQQFCTIAYFGPINRNNFSSYCPNYVKFQNLFKFIFFNCVYELRNYFPTTLNHILKTEHSTTQWFSYFSLVFVLVIGLK